MTDFLSYALPGGPIFVSRGMIELAPTEGALAGLLAHQLSHVVLRHGAIQRTRGEVFELGDIAGQTLGGITIEADDEPALLGSSFRVSAYFLKYDAAFEREANRLGAQIMTRAGYNSHDTVAMFKTIARTTADRSTTDWIDSHPGSGTGNGDPRTDADISGPADPSPKVVSSPPNRFGSIQAQLRMMAAAPTAAQAARTGGSQFVGAIGPLGIVVPSGETRRVSAGGVLRMDVPANWRRLSGTSAVVFAPADALVAVGNGSTAFTHGIQIGVARSPTGDLTGDLQTLLQHFGKTHTQLRWTPAYQRIRLGGREGLITVANNVSAVTRRFEYIPVAAVHLRDGSLLYIIGIAPQIEAGTYRGAFNRVRRSVQFVD